MYIIYMLYYFLSQSQSFFTIFNFKIYRSNDQQAPRGHGGIESRSFGGYESRSHVGHESNTGGHESRSFGGHEARSFGFHGKGQSDDPNIMDR